MVYSQASGTGAVITGLGADGNVTTTTVPNLTLDGYTPIEGGYVTNGMTLEAAFNALDTAVKNAVAGGGEVNQNAWSNITIPVQSTSTSAVPGQAEEITLAANAKTDTFIIDSGNKWIDVKGEDKRVTFGHALSGVTAGTTGAANVVPAITVDAAGHVTAVEGKTITPTAIGADAAGSAAAVLGQQGDTSDKATVYGVQALAIEASNAAGSKVASVAANAAGGIVIGGTPTAPTVGIKLDAKGGNAATLSADGLMVTIPEVKVPEYSITKDATSADYAAVYHLTKDGVNAGVTINIPKDLFVESGEIVENPAGQPEGKYLKLVLQNQTTPVYINVADLVDAYTPGNGIAISGNNQVSAKVVTANGLSVDTDGIKMGLASDTAAGAMSSADKGKLDLIDEGATANTITLNGAETANPSFYAPVGGGTAGQYLVSGGTGVAPTWTNLPTILKKYSAQNGALTAAGGAFTWTIAAATHGISDPTSVQLFESATGAMVMADITTSATGVTIVLNDTTGAGTLAANTYRVVIVG